MHTVRISKHAARIELRRQCLVCPEESPFTSVSVSSMIVSDLRDVHTPEQLCKFVNRYGFASGLDAKVRRGWVYEPVEVGLEYAAEVRAITEAAGQINLGRVPGRALMRRFVSKQSSLARLTFEGARMLLAAHVSRLLSKAQLMPQLFWNRATDAWNLALCSSSVLGAGAFDLSWRPAVAYFVTLEVMQADATVFCDICGQEYPPERSPNPNRMKYCPECRNSPKMWRRIKQRQRAR